MEEPVCEPPAVALYYISRLARQHVKVLLSGEGGDEAFAGYENYLNMLRLKRVNAALGPFAGPLGAAAAIAGRLFDEERLQRYGAGTWTRLFGALLQPHFWAHILFQSASEESFHNGVLERYLISKLLEIRRVVWPKT